jgi:hypothetical protein
MSKTYPPSFPPSDSPWGGVQHSKGIARGLWFVSTAGHGGIALSPERWADLAATFRGFNGYAPNGWLEEDLDCNLAAILWPTEFEPGSVYYAVGAVLTYRSGIPGESDYMKVPREWLESPAGEPARKIAADFKASVADCWERQGCSSDPQGWTVWLTHVTTRQQINALFPDYPRKNFYTYDELPRPMQQLAA